ncbi:hypothetical protein LPE509_01493 [Legionella pneumophila subsp. pneumophila LPE509]|nr:hypothetical protein LPE509_01493 [Legionella pneumophila subsp. pneumophila LPE509]
MANSLSVDCSDFLAISIVVCCLNIQITLTSFKNDNLE